MDCDARLDALGLGHLALVIGRAGGQTLLALSDAELRDLSAACLEVAVVRSWQQRSGAKAVERSARVDDSGRDLARDERSEEKDDKEEAAAEVVEGEEEQEPEALMLETTKKFPLRDLALHFEQLFVDHIGPWLDAVDIARLGMTCKWTRRPCHQGWCGTCVACTDALLDTTASVNLTERLYKQVCDRLDFKQTGTRSRPVPWVQIFVQHLCVECFHPAISTGSVQVGHVALCGDCLKTVAGLKTSELKSKGLPQTAQRFDDAVRRKILHCTTGF